MCKPSLKEKERAVPVKAPLLSVRSYFVKPSGASMLQTAGGVLAFLFGLEELLKVFFYNYQHMHPVLADETNRLILARHIGTDFFCCAMVAIMGLTCLYEVCPDLMDAVSRKPGSMPKAGFEARVFNYRPAALRICLFFFTYQVKNMYDTLVWRDGPEFIVHHLLCMFVAYGAINYDVCQFYAPFYFGISEFSTAVLCLLANFDDQHGVPGLADAFPAGKVFFGAIFAVTFIVCRVIMWSFVSYYFATDALNGLKSKDPRTEAAKPWVKVLLGCNIALTGLQLVWLGQIFIVAHEEISKMVA